MYQPVDPDDVQRVLTILQHKRNRVYMSKEIQQMTGLSDVIIRRIMRELNFAGYPVVSGPGGFHLSYDPETVRSYAHSLLERARWIKSRADMVRSISYQMQTSEAIHQ